DADGLQSLYREVCCQIGTASKVAVVAPDSVRSCCSHGVTTAEALRVERVAEQMWKVSGTPADCIRVALKGLKIQPQWILSGVNEGGNLGVDIHYSGTAAGAREAALLGHRSFALSQYLRRDRPRNWELSAQRAWHAVRELQAQACPIGHFWNVNLPVVDGTEIPLPIQMVEPEPQMLAFDYEEVPEPQWSDSQVESVDGQTVHWLKYRSNYQERPREIAKDVATCFAGSITATRLAVQLANK
ncbi:MAG: 5'/3'-nucleotidase SurE, partial [Bacteroidota bacterium]